MFARIVVRSVFSAFVFVVSMPATAPAQEPPSAAAQPAATLRGEIRRAGTLQPLSKVTVILEGTSIQTVSDSQGRFALDGVPAGAQHVVFAAPGLMPLRVDVIVAEGVAPPPLEVVLDAEVHYTEVVSVSPEARDLFVSYQPTSVLAGQDLARELEATLGATLERQPGVAERSFGPGPSRPVIRGLDGDRVLILEDGQRVGDLSSQSGDHGVTVNPASAARIEVVRGPATLLYGANAIGGLVNVITEAIPTQPVEGASGGIVTDLGSAAGEVVGATDLSWGNGRWAVRGGAGGRRTGEVGTPLGDVENSQSRAGFGNVAATWFADRAFLGASYGYDDTRYGVPVIEDGEIELTPRRHMVAVRGEVSDMGGFVDGIRANYASRRYRHDELHAGDPETRFENDTDELNVLVRHRPAGRFSGTIGGWVLNRNFLAEGEEALSPPVHERGAALFFYEEVTWPHLTFQFGARVNHTAYRPDEDLPSRDFTDMSGSVGLLFRPEATGDNVTFAASLARASRRPALEELYFFGTHHGNFAFEIGNPDLRSERALGADLSVRWRMPRATGEITYFRNSIDDFIFRNPISEEEFDLRFGHDAHAGPDDDHEDELPFIEFIAADSLLQGVEAHADIQLAGGLGLELGMDYVRGRLREANQPLPRMPPFRTRVGLHYQRQAFQAGGEVKIVNRQTRVFGEETPTDRYRRVKVFASYAFETAGVLSTITARLDNATDALYRNHLSLIKDFVPEMGRNFKLIYSLRF
jgi:iron complex outermembrane recepter protein